MNFFPETNFVEMLITIFRPMRPRNGFHWINAVIRWHIRVKLDDSFFINKATAAILVKIRSIFWGDPRCGKKIEINTLQKDRRTRLSPLEGQMIGANKS